VIPHLKLPSMRGLNVILSVAYYLNMIICYFCVPAVLDLSFRTRIDKRRYIVRNEIWDDEVIKEFWRLRCHKLWCNIVVKSFEIEPNILRSDPALTIFFFSLLFLLLYGRHYLSIFLVDSAIKNG
jgi:hypothetical protein